MKFMFFNIVWIFFAADMVATLPVEPEATQALIRPQPDAQAATLPVLQSSVQAAIQTFVQPSNDPNFVTWSG